MGVNNRTSMAKTRFLENQIKALELRRMGKRYSEIATHLGVSTSQAHRYVDSALSEIQESIENKTAQLKAEEMSRLDAMLSAIWASAKSGNLGAIDRVLRISERRSRLLGLDAPLKHATTDPSGEIERRPMAAWIVPPEMSVEEWQTAAQALIQRH